MRLLRASLVSLLLLCLLTGAVNAQSCLPLQGVQATLVGAQNFCRTSTGGTYTATEIGGGTSTHQWVYGTSSSGPWTPIAGATGTTYQLNGSDFPSTGMFWIAVTSTPQCGSPMTGGAQSVNLYETLPAPDTYGDEQICAGAASAIAQSAAQWDSYSWSITHGTLIPGSNGCGDDPTKRCVSFRPDGTGDVHLSLTVTAGSCSSNALRSVPLVENAPPSLYVWTPVCPGGQAGAYTSQYPAGTRSWSVTNGHIDTDWGDHIFFTADGNGPVDVTLTFTDTNGCSSMSTGRALLAGTKPVITLGTPACSTNGTATANGGWDSYDWSITNGTITYGQGTPNISFSGSGGGAMVLTVNGRANFGTFNCSTPSDPVTVPTTPTPTFTLGTPDICPYGTDTATAPEGYANYWWSVNNGYISAGEGTNAIQFSRGGFPNNPNDPISITLYVADANGCNAQSATATVMTRSIPPPTITLDTPDICPYGTNTATVPAQYANYWWSLNNGYLVSGEGTNSIRFSRGGYPNNPNDPITITLYVQDANGCPAQSATVSVPTRNIDAPVITLGTPDICPYGTNTATVPAQYANYWWSLNNGYLVSGEGTNSIRFSRGGYPNNPNDPITITLYVQDANGCPAQSATVSVPTRSIPAPVITLATPDVCPYGSDTATVPAQYANYWWQVEGGYITGGEYTNSITFQPSSGSFGNNNGIVTVTLYVQDGNGCPAPQSTVTVPVRTIPAPQITLATPEVCIFGSDTATVPAQYANYWWSIEGGSITGAQNTNAITFQPNSGSYGNNNGSVTITLSVQDGNGCPAPQATVTVPVRTIPAPQITVATPDICPFGSDSATVPAQYAYYSWTITNGNITGGQSTNSITFTPLNTTDPVTLSVSVQDGVGCPATSAPATVPIRTLAPPVIALGTGSCPTTASVTNAADYVQFQWSADNAEISSSTFESSVTFRARQNGHVTLTVVVYDGAGCQATSSVGYDVTGLPDISMSLPGVPYCYGSAATASVPDGGPGVTYQWSLNSGRFLGSSTSPSVTFIPEADTLALTVTATNGQGCSASGTSYILVNRPPVGDFNSVPVSVCANGTATISTYANGVSYDWQVIDGEIVSGAGTSAITFRAHNAATVTVRLTKTGQYGCGATYERIIPVTSVDATINPSGPTTFCTGGSVTLTASSGASYLWSTGATTQAITVNSAGNYSVTVTNANGCSATSAPSVVTVDDPTASITANGPTTFCAGGSVTLTASAGASYLWSTGATTASIVASTTGSYSVTVTTAAGCNSTSQPLAVTVNAPPDATITAPSSVCASTNGDNARVASVFGGSYAWTITGGTITGGAGTYQIAFKPSGNDPVSLGVTVTNASGCAASSTRVVDVHSVPKPAITPSGAASFCNSGLLTAPAGYTMYSWKRDGGQIGGASAQTFLATQSGTYSVIVWDATDCWVESDPVSITVSTTPVASISAQNNVCAGSTYGAVSAGSAASYQWTVTNGTIVDGQGTQVIHYTSGASDNVTLTLTVANAQGCSDTQSINIPIANVQAAITPSGPLTICPGGSVTLTASAGASYIWSNNAYAQSTTVTQAGSYSVRVFDAAGCYAQSQSVTVSVASPSATITPSGPTTFCAGGSVTLSAPAGYSYTWSTGATTQSITVNQSNTYSVTVQDSNGCTASSSTAVTVNPLPQVVFTTPSVVCGTSESAQEVQPLGAGLTYAWSTTNGAITQNAGHRVYFTANAGATQVVLTVTISDANGCSSTDSITLPVHTPPSATITPSGPTTFCSGGSVTLSAPAGMSSYSWSNGATTQSINVSTQDSYTVTVRDANLCSTQSSPVVVTVNPLPAPAITASGPTTFCDGGNVTLTAPAGFSSYRWNTNATTQSIIVSSTGNYSVTVNDGNCSGTSDATAVTVRTLPTATVSGTTAICPGGSATITATLTGTAPWNVTWSDNVAQTITSGTTATRSVSPSATKTYTVTSLTDAYCAGSSTGSATITVKTLPTATVSGGGTICPGGSATITAALTGTAPFTVIWSDNVTQTINSGSTASRNVSPAATTTYTVTSVSDAASCPRAGTGSATVTVKTLPTATVSGGGAICPGASATITATLTGTAPWSVIWSDNVTQSINTGTTATRSVSPAATTTYTVTSITDASGCAAVAGSGSATVSRSVAASITTQPANKSTTINTNVTVSVVAAGTSPISYQWFKNNGTIVTGATSSSYTTSFPAKGNYQFYVEVWNACNTTHVKSHNVTITVN